MGAIAIFFNPHIGPARALADEIIAWTARQGWEGNAWPISDGLDDAAWQAADYIITLGGDGSILRAAHLAAPHGIPLLGVNLGRVGFLTESTPETWRATLSRVMAGRYWIEERMMLHVVARRQGEVLAQAEALNDVVTGRGARAQVVHLHVHVDGGRLATYVADGLIVATPTGSTAYALAAGGPILPPQLRNILLVPVAPHLSMERPLVLDEGVTVHLTVAGQRPAVLTVDGAIEAELQAGDEVVVAAGKHPTRFARVQERTYFYKTLLSRLSPRDRDSD